MVICYNSNKKLWQESHEDVLLVMEACQFKNYLQSLDILHTDEGHYVIFDYVCAAICNLFMVTKCKGSETAWSLHLSQKKKLAGTLICVDRITLGVFSYFLGLTWKWASILINCPVKFPASSHGSELSLTSVQAQDDCNFGQQLTEISGETPKQELLMQALPKYLIHKLLKHIQRVVVLIQEVRNNKGNISQ